MSLRARDMIHAALAVAVVVSALAVAWQGRRAEPLGADLSPEGERARPTVYVLFQAADCDSRLSFVDVLRRPSLSRLDVAGVVLGSAAELDRATVALRRAGTKLRLRLGRRADRESAARLGYRETPFLVVIDGSRRVRLTAPLPRTDRERTTLASALESLASTL